MYHVLFCNYRFPTFSHYHQPLIPILAPHHTHTHFFLIQHSIFPPSSTFTCHSTRMQWSVSSLFRTKSNTCASFHSKQRNSDLRIVFEQGRSHDARPVWHDSHRTQSAPHSSEEFCMQFMIVPFLLFSLLHVYVYVYVHVHVPAKTRRLEWRQEFLTKEEFLNKIFPFCLHASIKFCTNPVMQATNLKYSECENERILGRKEKLDG